MTITVEEAQAKLAELIDQLNPGEELVITRSSEPLARLVKEKATGPKPQPIFGRGRGKLIIVDDSDSHLEDFADYM